jgi:hypothetical protein
MFIKALIDEILPELVMLVALSVLTGAVIGVVITCSIFYFCGG